MVEALSWFGAAFLNRVGNTEYSQILIHCGIPSGKCLFVHGLTMIPNTLAME